MARVHGDASGVTGGLKEGLERIGRMEGECREWRGCLERVEGGLGECKGLVGGIVERVQGVVLGLEERVKKFEGA
jgi:hypothetical protein